jgi:hypothetical protein
MRRLNTQVTEDLDDRFRKEVGKRFGAKKGSLRKAVTEALELWIKQAKPR